MLNVEDLETELTRNKAALDEWFAKNRDLTASFASMLELLEIPDMDGISNVGYAGARPLEQGTLIRPYKREWEEREGAVGWMDRVLSGCPVAAVDGSQIYPSKEMFLSVAVVQSGLVLNRHGAGDYESASRLTILPPSEFGEWEMLPKHKDELTDAHRFQMECIAMLDLFKKESGIFGFLDGSLVLSHIQSLRDDARQIYLGGLLDLLGASEESENVLAAYIDLSRSTDLFTLLCHLSNEDAKSKVWDVQLLRDRMHWGDRTKVFQCDRDDRNGGRGTTALDLYGRFKDQICFFYLQLGHESPARVEFPAWIYKKGLVDRLADVVRAEVLIKGDYPDILYRAHNQAVIRTREAELFDRLIRKRFSGDSMGQSKKEMYKNIGGL